MTSTVFYPEMNGTEDVNAQIIVSRLYNRYCLKCLNGLELKENRSITFQYEKDGNMVYYATESGYEKIRSQYNTSFASYLD